MKNSALIIVVILSIVGFQTIDAQQRNWEIEGGFQGELMTYSMASNAAVNSKFRGDKVIGLSYGPTLSVNRKMNDKWTFGVMVGEIFSDYTLYLDRDFGDLDKVVNFSDPVEDGDYLNLHRINYENNYFRWSINARMNLADDKSKVIQPYFGFGLEGRQLRDTKHEVFYSDSGSGGALLSLFTAGAVSFSPNNSPTARQRTEALNYYNSRVENMPFFLHLSYGLKFNFKNGISILAEPNISIAARGQHSSVISNQVNLGVKHAISIRF